MGRRLLLLLAALSVLATTSLAGIATAAATGAGAQTRVRAFIEPAPTLNRVESLERSCSHPGSVAAQPKLTAGFCVATEETASASLDTDVLIRDLDGGETDAVDRALAGRTPLVSPTAAAEYIAKGDPEL